MTGERVTDATVTSIAEDGDVEVTVSLDDGRCFTVVLIGHELAGVLDDYNAGYDSTGEPTDPEEPCLVSVLAVVDSAEGTL